MTDPNLLPPKPPADWPESIAHLRDSFAANLNVYRMMAHHPDLLKSWACLRAHIVTENALGQERLEVVILRIASVLGSRYEWDHHVARAHALGFEMSRIHALKGLTDHMTPEDALLARSVDALIQETCLPRDLLSELTALVGTSGVLDLMATIGFYKTLGCILETYQIALDDLETDER